MSMQHVVQINRIRLRGSAPWPVPLRRVLPFLLCAWVLAACADESGPPDFQLNLSPPQIAGAAVTVNGGVVAPVVRIQWDWGDGIVDRHLYFPATHTYATAGRYTITVTVFDADNHTAAQSVAVDVAP